MNIIYNMLENIDHKQSDSSGDEESVVYIEKLKSEKLIRNEFISKLNIEEDYSEEEEYLISKYIKLYISVKDANMKKIKSLDKNIHIYKKTYNNNSLLHICFNVFSKPDETLAKLWSMPNEKYLNINEISNISSHKKLSEITINSINLSYKINQIWKKINGGHYVLLNCEDKEYDTKNNFIITIIKKKNGLTKIDSVFDIKIDDNNKLDNIVNENISFMTEIKKYFNKLCSIDLINEHNAKEIGDLLITNLKKDGSVEHNIDNHFKNVIYLKEINIMYPWFKPMIYNIILNKLNTPSFITTELDNLSIKDGQIMGDGFSSSIVMCLTAESAVNEWINKYPALQTFDNLHSWFRPMMDSIAEHILSNVFWGIKMRIFIGTTLSLLDTISDLYMSYIYIVNSKYTFAIIILSTVLLNVFLQIIVVLIQNYKSSYCNIFREILIVLSFTKQVVDAKRVTSGEKQKPYNTFEPIIEMICTKVIEILAESMPSAIFQIFMYLKSDYKSNFTFVSIILSAFTIAYTVSTITYDVDIEPSKRKLDKDFYGFIPDEITKKMSIFVFMYFNSFIHIMCRLLTCFIAMTIDYKIIIYFNLVNFAIYFLYKMLRNDFYYWIKINGFVGIVVAFVFRFAAKLVTDFTGMIHFRHPLDLGGAYWLFSIIECQITMLMSVFFCDKFISEEYASYIPYFKYFGVAFHILWVISAIFVGKNINKKYIHTFYSTETGKEHCINYFLRNVDDDKHIILYSNHILWLSIEDSVKDWLHENWQSWNKNKPDWFEDILFSNIPEQIIPNNHHKIRKFSTLHILTNEIKKTHRKTYKQIIFGKKIQKVSPEL